MSNKSRITKVSIEGFRSLKSVKDLTLTNLNVFIGPNGSGKSNLIGFLQMLSYAMEGSLRYFISKHGFGNSMLFMGSETTPILHSALEFETDDNPGRIKYQLTMEHAARDMLVCKGEKIACLSGTPNQRSEQELGTGGEELAVLKIANPVRAALLHDLDTALRSDFGLANIPAGESQKIAKLVRDTLRSMDVYQFHDTSLSARIRNVSDLSQTQRLYPDAGNLVAMLYALKTNREPHYHAIVKTIGRMVPDFKDFVLQPEAINPHKIMLRWRGANPNYVFGSHQISDGSLRFMALVTLLMQPEDMLPDVIIIDEPELGLHPAAESLVGALIHAASQSCQVIVATQSASLLDSFDPQDIIVTEMQEDGATTFKRQSADKLCKWLERYSLGGLWEKNLMGGRP